MGGYTHTTRTLLKVNPYIAFPNMIFLFITFGPDLLKEKYARQNRKHIMKLHTQIKYFFLPIHIEKKYLNKVCLIQKKTKH